MRRTLCVVHATLHRSSGVYVRLPRLFARLSSQKRFYLFPNVPILWQCPFSVPVLAWYREFPLLAFFFACVYVCLFELLRAIFVVRRGFLGSMLLLYFAFFKWIWENKKARVQIGVGASIFAPGLFFQNTSNNSVLENTVGHGPMIVYVCMFVCLSVRWHVCVLVCLLACLFVWCVCSSLCLAVSSPICLLHSFVRLCVCVFVCVCAFVLLVACLSVWLFVCLCNFVCLYVCVSVRYTTLHCITLHYTTPNYTSVHHTTWTLLQTISRKANAGTFSKPLAQEVSVKETESPAKIMDD